MTDRKYAYDPSETGLLSVNQRHLQNGEGTRVATISHRANIAIFNVGYSMGWTSPVNMILGDVTKSPLDDVITVDEEAWIASLLPLGAIFGPFFAGFAASSIGRKWGLMSCAIPAIIGWILIVTTFNVAMIYAGRIFWGLSVGMSFTLSTMYCAEIATDDCRGALGSYLQMFITLGFLMVYSVGPFVSYHVIAYLGLAIVTVFCISFFFMPESPIFHLTKGNKEAATECLAKIRGRSHEAVKSEVDKMEREIQMSMAKTATFADVFRGSNFKALYISLTLMLLQQVSGINAVLFFLSNIFSEAGASLDASISAIIVGAMQVLASSLTPFAADKLGRRPLLLISSCGTSIGLGLLAVYFILAENENPVVESIGFLPIVALVLFIVTYCWGLGPLPWAVMSELFPIEVKATAAPIATAFCSILTFLVTRFFSPIALAIGMGMTFLMFGVFCACGFFFTLFFVPETKGKSFQEIQEMLAGKSSKIEKTEVMKA
ncbi:unnamed protein product [Arctia plantaginis]|uniref:Major facilitator superfamily (MFS) profile domain-containing protein n=1 Tax=Arctia plantaginis TaxID=874455 RepID=A0A8S1B9R1_ARCPL|nr:unnamed protein product [Arctia plantaginis]